MLIRVTTTENLRECMHKLSSVKTLLRIATRQMNRPTRTSPHYRFPNMRHEANIHDLVSAA